VLSVPSPVLAKALCFGAVRPFIRPDRMLLPSYLMNGLSNLDETYSEYSLTPTDDLIRFCKSKVKVIAGRRGDEGIHLDASRRSSSSSRL